MNLTVGPLPPAVYWRRRAVVLGVLVVAVLLVVAMCGGTGESKTPGAANPTHSSSPTTSSSVLTPIIGGTASASPSATASVSVDPTTAPPAGPPPTPCLDTEMSLTVVYQVRAADVVLQMKIKNISARSCTRDVGGIPQEIHVATSTSQPSDPVVWSSDFCQAANQPPDVRTFDPGIESILPPGGVLWKKNYVGAGCTTIKAAPAGTYSVAAKMGSLISPVVHVTI
jgi:hypothetical protein